MDKTAVTVCVAVLAAFLSGCGREASVPSSKGDGASAHAGKPKMATDLTAQGVRSEIRRLAAAILEMPAEKLDTATPLLSKTIGADELDLAEIVMEIEDTFDLTIPDDELGKGLKPMELLTVDDLASYVSAKLKSKKAKEAPSPR